MSEFKMAPKAENKAFPTSEKFSMTEKVQYAEGSVVSKIIIRNERGNVTLFAFDKDEFLSEHTAPFDAIVQVLDGVGEVIIDGKSFVLNVGESIIMPANVRHAVIAKEQFKMLLTMIK
jgi:quercetin dioxygenase-like cupin family protein